MRVAAGASRACLTFAATITDSPSISCLPACLQAYREHLAFMVNRVNTISNVTYR